MKSKLSILAALVIGGAALFLTGAASSGAAKKFEYKTIRPGPEKVGVDVEKKRVDLLNEAGGDGWELISVVDDGGHPTFYFKRQI